MVTWYHDGKTGSSGSYREGWNHHMISGLKPEGTTSFDVQHLIFQLLISDVQTYAVNKITFVNTIVCERLPLPEKSVDYRSIFDN